MPPDIDGDSVDDMDRVLLLRPAENQHAQAQFRIRMLVTESSQQPICFGAVRLH